MNDEELVDFLHLVRPTPTDTMLAEKSAQINKLQTMMTWYVEENMMLNRTIVNQQDEITKLTLEKHNEST